MRRVVLLWALSSAGCVAFDPNAPEVQAFIEHVAKTAGDQSANAAARELGVRDEATVEQMRKAAYEAVAPQLAEAMAMIASQQADLRSTLATALDGGAKATGAVGTATGNPLFLALSALLGLGAVQLGRKKLTEIKGKNA